ncbi:hypothetical protein KVR01_000301 [Diaporthe batatas]|uniref:uncharacterized protein n=1 Tax=Diaporthe batatas TaxID=748121 RepID=UPI001D03B72A|nr:uncharacterized protein KVR01_000301 [Diaporthe batatas]KAG8169556.1 hypothetical protein KVR01_000301 [Diaporthe batatas]
MTSEASKMQANSRHSQSYGLPGDDDSVCRLLFTSKKEDARAPTQPATRKRKTPASGGEQPSPAKRPRTTISEWLARRRKSMLRFEPEETQVWVETIELCKSKGLLRPNSRQSGSVWEKLIEEFTRIFPEKKWTREEIEIRMANEKRKCDAFLDALADLGPSSDEGTDDMAEDAEQDSGVIVKHYPDALRPQNKRLGDPPEDMLPQDMATDYGDTLRNLAPSTSPMTAAALFSKVPGYNDLTLASMDLQARYGGRDGQPGQYSNFVLSFCLFKLKETFLSPVIWNGLTEDRKNAWMKIWAREAAEAERAFFMIMSKSS